ncbi:MAG TPA: BlaI/MecI/CopY family transcriptional regulator [Polyangiaceae bacterium]|jgi:predicted transcriptional regulator|nr:BlaI/MecI/CopY family transcriptional regulator [Polyangiaceae bacterium]
MAKARKPPVLTRVECEVMKVLWQHVEGVTAHDVVRELGRPIAYTTALTMLRTLEQKGYVSHKAHPDGGRAHLFRATVQERDARQSHVRELVRRLFHGEANALVSGLLQEEEFSRDALEALRLQIEEKLTEGTTIEKGR